MMTPTEPPAGAFVLPSTLVEQGFVLRPETEADIPFLRRLYASTRWDELAITNWSDAEKLAFADSQFGLQHQHYRAFFPTTAWGVLEDNDVPVGRLYLERRDTTLHILDIALLPEWRGRGIGTAIMEWICAQAGAAGKSVTIAVEKFNPAQTLYRRLGFREIADQGPHWEMERRAAADERTGVS
jgi:ribosomal protein S18 acetylase RimI-like enzyme